MENLNNLNKNLNKENKFLINKKENENELKKLGKLLSTVDQNNNLKKNEKRLDNNITNINYYGNNLFNQQPIKKKIKLSNNQTTTTKSSASSSSNVVQIVDNNNNNLLKQLNLSTTNTSNKKLGLKNQPLISTFLNSNLSINESNSSNKKKQQQPKSNNNSPSTSIASKSNKKKQQQPKSNNNKKKKHDQYSKRIGNKVVCCYNNCKEERIIKLTGDEDDQEKERLYSNASNAIKYHYKSTHEGKMRYKHGNKRNTFYKTDDKLVKCMYPGCSISYEVTDSMQECRYNEIKLTRRKKEIDKYGQRITYHYKKDHIPKLKKPDKPKKKNVSPGTYSIKISNNEYKCTKCNYTINYAKERIIDSTACDKIKRHYNKEHQNVFGFCNFCGLVFKSRKSEARHMSGGDYINGCLVIQREKGLLDSSDEEDNDDKSIDNLDDVIDNKEEDKSIQNSNKLKTKECCNLCGLVYRYYSTKRYHNRTIKDGECCAIRRERKQLEYYYPK